MKYHLECKACGAEFSHTNPYQTCPRCGSVLEVVYDGKLNIPKRRGQGFWDYESLLPDGRYSRYELGGTRVVHAQGSRLMLKLEIENPTRSFKDRGSVVEIGKAHEYGYSEVVCASTGNMAYSIAYYAKLAGLSARVYISNNANKDKINDIRAVGDAEVVRVDGDFTRAQKEAERYARRNEAFLTGDYCYRKEGQRIMAYEIMTQVPDATHIIVPVGNATLLSGIIKAIGEMRAAKALKHTPKIVAVQAERTEPFVRAFLSGRRVRYVRPSTKADAIAVGFPTFGDDAAEGLRRLGGEAVTVTDLEMKAEARRFFKGYGLVAELAGVASIAAARKMRFSNGDVPVAVVSGGNV